MNAGDMPPRNLFNKADFGGGLFARAEGLVTELVRVAADLARERTALARARTEMVQLMAELRAERHHAAVLAERLQEMIDAMGAR